MNRKRKSALAAVLLLLLVSPCGASDSPASSQAEAPATQPATETVPAASTDETVFDIPIGGWNSGERIATAMKYHRRMNRRDILPASWKTSPSVTPGIRYGRGTWSATRADTRISCGGAPSEEISGFPAPKQYYGAMAWENYVIVDTVNPYEQTKETRGLEYILDNGFNEFFSAKWISPVCGNMRGGGVL